MAEALPFSPVKLICGIIASDTEVFYRAEEHLVRSYGPVDSISRVFDFLFTDYYQKEMGEGLKRKFLSFKNLISPEELSRIKIQTNGLEETMRDEFKAQHRIVNLDPGYCTPAALFLGTTKDFAHRVPLQQGIYAHLEFLFGKNDVRTLSWTYPDYQTDEYKEFFLDVRSRLLRQLKEQK